MHKNAEFPKRLFCVIIVTSRVKLIRQIDNKIEVKVFVNKFVSTNKASRTI